MVENKRSVIVNGIEYPFVLVKIPWIEGRFEKRICVYRDLHLCVPVDDEEKFLNGDTMTIKYIYWDEIQDLHSGGEYRLYTIKELKQLIGTRLINKLEIVETITNTSTNGVHISNIGLHIDFVFKNYRHYEPGKTFVESKPFGVKL